MQKRINIKGFTLVELLVAMVVTGVVLAAVATLAFAMSSSISATDDLSLKQTQIRFASLRITELIRRCRLIYSYNAEMGSIEVWQDNNGDNAVDADELVSIQAGAGRNYIKIQEPDSESFFLMPQCSNVQFEFDNDPPLSRLVKISFKMTEDGNVRQYQISAGLRGWAGNLLDGEGNIVASDDD